MYGSSDFSSKPHVLQFLRRFEATQTVPENSASLHRASPVADPPFSVHHKFPLSFRLECYLLTPGPQT